MFTQHLSAAPSEAPIVELKNLERNDALLVWKEIPQKQQRGFIVNYTVYYSTGNGSDMNGKNLTEIISVQNMHIIINSVDYISIMAKLCF